MQILVLLGVELTEHPVEQHFREADHRVERRAQLVRHAGQKLGLVVVRHLELPALLLELLEELRVLDGQGRLGGEGAQQLDDVRREFPGRAPVDDEPADDVVLAQERHRQERAISRAHERLAHPRLIHGVLKDVGDLRRLARLGHPAHRAFPLADRRRAQQLDELRVDVLGRAQVEGVGVLVVLVNGAAIAA